MKPSRDQNPHREGYRRSALAAQENTVKVLNQNKRGHRQRARGWLPRRALWAIFAASLAAIVLLLIFPRKREPEYSGRTLSQWLFAAADRSSARPALPTTAETADAI